MQEEWTAITIELTDAQLAGLYAEAVAYGEHTAEEHAHRLLNNQIPRERPFPADENRGGSEQ